jgi:hypothetical protein
MARKFAPVTDHPTGRRGRCKPETLVSAVEGSERDMLVALRSKVAARLDADDLPVHALAQLVRQFRSLDREIRAIDARVAAAAEQVADDQADGDAQAGWDESAL